MATSLPLIRVSPEKAAVNLGSKGIDATVMAVFVR